MLNKKIIFCLLLNFGLLLGATQGVRAAEKPDFHTIRNNQFRQIEQPLVLKAGVTLAGLALIGLELWWFLFSKSQAKQASLVRESNS